MTSDAEPSHVDRSRGARDDGSTAGSAVTSASGAGGVETPRTGVGDRTRRLGAVLIGLAGVVDLATGTVLIGLAGEPLFRPTTRLLTRLADPVPLLRTGPAIAWAATDGATIAGVGLVVVGFLALHAARTAWRGTRCRSAMVGGALAALNPLALPLGLVGAGCCRLARDRFAGEG